MGKKSIFEKMQLLADYKYDLFVSQLCQADYRYKPQYIEYILYLFLV